MADFHQGGVITTLHRLGDRGLESLERELGDFARARPMGVVLPSLYAELEGPALGHILDEIGGAGYVADVIVGLDRAGEREFEHAREFFSRLPQRTRVLWHDGPRLRAIDARLAAEGLSPRQPGKGRNVWFCMGYVLACDRLEAVALQDCDVLTYGREQLARLLYPLVNPAFELQFCKGYYPRIAGDRLSGRVSRLFVTPLVRALRRVLGPLDYLEYLDAFRYPLSGEFGMRRDLLSSVRIPSDWGLEVGVLSEVYRNLARNHVCQVDIAERYDHKHQPLSAEDPEQGLAKMSTDIAKSLYRKVATEGITLTPELFRTLKATYYRIALDMVEQYHCDARINGLEFDRHGEERAVETFLGSIMRAGEQFLANPMEVPFIPNWNRVRSALPGILDELCAAVEADNAR